MVWRLGVSLEGFVEGLQRVRVNTSRY
jgi:hypothetical protein